MYAGPTSVTVNVVVVKNKILYSPVQKYSSKESNISNK